MDIWDWANTLVSAVVALIGGLMSTRLFDRFIEQRQRVLISAETQEVRAGGARRWTIQFEVQRPINKSEPIICFGGELGTSIIGYRVLEGAPLGTRVHLNERRQIECDVSFLTPGQVIQVRCHFSRPSVPQFYSADKALKIDPTHNFQQVYTPAQYLLLAKWRFSWVVIAMVWLTILALIRIVYLGFL